MLEAYYIIKMTKKIKIKKKLLIKYADIYVWVVIKV